MNIKQKGTTPPPPPPSISLGDIYYVLFRHKWLIILLSALGVACSFAIQSLWHFPYSSEAKVLIHFIQDTTATSQIDGNTKVRTPNDQGGNILNTQLELMTSEDLAFQVASNLGPAKILGKPAETNEYYAAAAFIRGNLKAEVIKNSDVILLTFTANDPLLVPQVLSKLIEAYEDKYKAIYRTPGFTENDLTMQTDEARSHLGETANALQNAKVKLNVTDLQEASKYVAGQTDKTEQGIFETRTELAESEARIKDLQERLPAALTNALVTNHTSNVTATATMPPPPSPELASKYQTLNAMVNSLRVKEQDLLGTFTTNTKIVQNAMQQRKEAEEKVQQFEAENPGVLALKRTEPGSPTPTLAPVMDPYAALHEEVSKFHALTAKYIQLTNQLNLIRTNAVALDHAEEQIKTAESENDVAATKYKYFLMETARQRINDTIGNKVSGITTAEQPTPPSHDSKQIFKMVWGTLGFFLFLAFGLPFLIEVVLDRSFKHPLDVQARIAAPFFITIPRTNGNGKFTALKQANHVALLSANGSETPAPPDAGPVAAWDARHELRPFFETLRDRLMTYFEMINLTHKPKLVAVTSCGGGAGVTTTASGLASSLSEIGEGNVLLVNMNVGDGEAQHFFKGKLNCGIEDVLGNKKRDQAQVHGNLYVAKEMDSDDKLPRVLPKRFSHLVPMMKASDFDYIIFDMPPVSEISITPRLARFMDMVLLVIESGKTSRESAMRTASLLAETKTNVGLVFNKNRSYLPKSLDHSL